MGRENEEGKNKEKQMSLTGGRISTSHADTRSENSVTLQITGTRPTRVVFQKMLPTASNEPLTPAQFLDLLWKACCSLEREQGKSSFAFIDGDILGMPTAISFKNRPGQARTMSFDVGGTQMKFEEKSDRAHGLRWTCNGDACDSKLWTEHLKYLFKCMQVGLKFSSKHCVGGCLVEMKIICSSKLACQLVFQHQMDVVGVPHRKWHSKDLEDKQ